MTRDRPDIFSHLVDDDVRKTRDPVIGKGMLTRDTQLVVIAGSDTTSATLTNVFYRLAKHPEKLRILQKEIDPLFAPGEEFSYELITDLPYLEGIINEALRLHPPVPSGLQRMTPKEGVTIAGTYIPGDTVLTVPTHILHRGTYSVQKGSLSGIVAD
jgi:cytochrome P450 family 628